MKFPAITILISLSILMTGCNGATYHETFGISGVYNWGCNSNQREIAKTAEWDEAVIVTEVIKKGIYQTGVLALKEGIPHIIEVTNLDDQSRSFSARTLFKNSSILKVVHEGQNLATPCLQAVIISPNKASEIHLVPLKKGYYDYHETYLTTPGLDVLPFLAPIGSVGVSYVY